MTKKVIAVFLVFGFIFASVIGYSQSESYEEFYGQFVTDRAEDIRRDGNSLEEIINSWSEEEVTKSTVLSKLQDMEEEADRYFGEVVNLVAPEGREEKHEQNVYIFATWSNIIGLFREGIAENNQKEIEAASVLSNYFQRRVAQFGDDTY